MHKGLGQHKMTTGGGFVTGLACGAAIGGAAALLFAPRPGSDLRAKVGESMNHLGRRAKDMSDRTSEKVSEMAGQASDAVQNVADRAADMRARNEEFPGSPIRPS